MTGHYQPALVALSILIAVFTAYVALDLAAQRTATPGSSRWIWLGGAAVAMGGGIWAMHFIGMLAMVMPIPVAYDLFLTGASLALPILVAGGGLALADTARRVSWGVYGGGLLMGCGIVGMHYIGMAAMVMDAAVRYDPALVGASILIAIGASTAALKLAYAIQSARFRLIGAVVMGSAVVGMHYVGMAAASFTPRPPGQSPMSPISGVEPYLLGVEVATLTGIVLVLALMSSTFARLSAERRAAEVQRKAEHERALAQETLRESEERYRLAVQATGLGTWDWDIVNNVVIWSDRTQVLLGLTGGGPARFETFLDRVHPDDRAEVDAKVRAALDPDGSGLVSVEYRIVLPGGETRWLRSQGQVFFRGGDRAPARMLGTKLDITAFRDTESRLKLSLAEKEMLLKEIHHRIKNNMQAITGILLLESSQMRDPAARDGLEAVAGRITAMARLHEHLYSTSDLRRIDLGTYFHELRQSLLALHRGAPVTISVESEPLACDMDVAIPVGLIVNELVTNSLKHAFPDGRDGSIRIRLFRDGEGVVVEVADDGVGPSPASGSSGIGSHLLAGLAMQLEADLSIDQRVGYRTRLRLPAERFMFRALEYQGIGH